MSKICEAFVFLDFMVVTQTEIQYLWKNHRVQSLKCSTAVIKLKHQWDEYLLYAYFRTRAEIDQWATPLLKNAFLE